MSNPLPSLRYCLICGDVLFESLADGSSVCWYCDALIEDKKFNIEQQNFHTLKKSPVCGSVEGTEQSNKN